MAEIRQASRVFCCRMQEMTALPAIARTTVYPCPFGDPNCALRPRKLKTVRIARSHPHNSLLLQRIFKPKPGDSHGFHLLATPSGSSPNPAAASLAPPSHPPLCRCPNAGSPALAGEGIFLLCPDMPALCLEPIWRFCYPQKVEIIRHFSPGPCAAGPTQ